MKLIPDARLVTIPGMGHALSQSVVEPVTAAILAHTTRTEREGLTTSVESAAHPPTSPTIEN